MRNILISFLIFFAFPLFSEKQPIFEPSNEEEALFLRRIVEFWEEKEFNLVELEIQNYLHTYPKSPYSNHLAAMLADISWEKKEYEKALLLYQKIIDKEPTPEIFCHYLQCLFELKNFEKIISQAESYLTTTSDMDDKQRDFIRFVLAEAYYNQSLSYEDQDDKQQEFTQKARLLLEDLLHGEYLEQALDMLTSIHQILKDYPTAAEKYLFLAEQNPSFQEDFLFQAALLACEYDKDLAIQTFGTLCRIGKKWTSQAAYNRMILLLETQRYSDFILLQDQIRDHLKREELPFFHFCLGKSFFVLKEYANALKELKRFLRHEEQIGENELEGLLLGMHSAYHLDDREIFEEYFQIFEKKYSEEKEFPKTLFMKALFEKKHQNFSQAEEDFARLEQKMELFDQKEELFYEIAQLYYEKGDFKKAAFYFRSLLEEFFKSDLRADYWRYRIKCLIQLVELSDSQEKEQKPYREELENGLITLLEEKLPFESQEKNWFSYLLGQTAFHLEHYDLTRNYLLNLIERDSEFIENSVVYLLLAHCYKNLDHDWNQFFSYIEKALDCKEGSISASSLHLTLFNAYSELAQEEKKEREKYLDQAAEHLYLAQGDPQAIIQQDNLIWLANFYYSRIEKFLHSDWRNKISQDSLFQKETSRAVELLERILFKEDVQSKECILQLEVPFYHLTMLYGWQKEDAKKLSLLEKMIIFYENNKENTSKWRDAIYLEIGRCYEEEGNYDKAIQSYQKILNSKENYVYWAPAAYYHASLLWKTLPEEERTAKNTKVIEILRKLKNLKVQRAIELEPLHIEAALDAIDIQLQLDKQPRYGEKHCLLLKKLQTDFWSAKDVISSQYHQKRKKMAEKDKILQAYLRYIDMLILFCEGELTKNQNGENRKKSVSQIQESLAFFIEEDLIVTSYLNEKIENCFTETSKEIGKNEK